MPDPTVKSSGTQTAVITTEHTLLDTADPGTYQLQVNLVNMVNDDEVEIRIYTKVLSGDSYGVAFMEPRKHAQGADGEILVSPPLMVPTDAKFTLKQVAGTGRDFKWSVSEA